MINEYLSATYVITTKQNKEKVIDETRFGFFIHGMCKQMAHNACSLNYDVNCVENKRYVHYMGA